MQLKRLFVGNYFSDPNQMFVYLCGRRMKENLSLKVAMKVVLLGLKEKAIIQNLRKFITNSNSWQKTA